MNEIADLPLNGFRKSPTKNRPDTLEKGGGKSAPPPPEPVQPPQPARAPKTEVYRARAQQAGRGGMSAGYQSTLLTGTSGVTNESIAGRSALGATMSANSKLGL